MNSGSIAFFGILVGLVAHQSDKFIKRRDWSESTRQVVRYVIGVMASFPLILLMFWRLTGADLIMLWDLALSYMVVFTAVGLGVIMGHWLERKQ